MTQPPTMTEWTEAQNKTPPAAQPHPAPATAADAVAWLHSCTGLSRMALDELTHAFARLQAETGYTLAKAKANV